MIAGCYHLAAYCDGQVLRRRLVNGPYHVDVCMAKVEVGEMSRTEREAKAEARARGWRIRGDAVLCPACQKEKPPRRAN